jgi:hypothetical protein
MNKWPAPKSNVRIVLGLTFFIGGFIWVVCFFKFIPFSPLDRLTGWLGAITAGLLFFLGICIGFSAKPKGAIAGFVIFVAWSLGLILLPVPEGYGEAVLGGWFLVLCAMVALYEKFRKKSTYHKKGTEKMKTQRDNRG